MQNTLAPFLYRLTFGRKDLQSGEVMGAFWPSESSRHSDVIQPSNITAHSQGTWIRGLQLFTPTAIPHLT